MSAIERFMKIEMIKELSPSEIVDFIDKLEAHAEAKLKASEEECHRLDVIAKHWEYQYNKIKGVKK